MPFPEFNRKSPRRLSTEKPTLVSPISLTPQPSASQPLIPKRKPSPNAPGQNASQLNADGTYPSRLLLYYAGKRTVYLGTLKLYAVLLFSYCSLIVAPPLFGEEGQERNRELLGKLGSGLGLENLELPGWVLPSVIVVGSFVPLVMFQWLSPPYVTHIYTTLPTWATANKSNLFSYLSRLPKDASLEMATIRWFGRPKLTKITVGDLEFKRARLGCVNTISRPTFEDKKGNVFYVDWRRSPATVPEPEAVGEVAKAVRKWQEEKLALEAEQLAADKKKLGWKQ
ncbi:hypothetical protein BZA77DRAFT_356811 [Pyronema omphalodes]|nr:hypothetical protein BZA77DRAFT_357673 [Pyronema omphalodes]KAI5814300.1 hypothetical protein BZA77DRAFT_356811 [Pyronema omphalodes]